MTQEWKKESREVSSLVYEESKSIDLGFPVNKYR
jgi:hypothetical protein